MEEEKKYSSRIPEVTLQSNTVYKAQMNYKGDLVNQYSPLQNLTDQDTKLLTDFTTGKLNFDLQHPVDIITQEHYDGSVNLIINDDKNIPRLINSRFSVQEDKQFLIPDHRGSKDTNIYDESTFEVDTNLKAIPLKIPALEYLGLLPNQGKLSCGAYTFYFKLSDADGNETEVVAESGIVQTHIGEPNNPSTIRMGLENENTNKAVRFKVSNIDSGFDYIHVYYARSSSGSDLAIAETYHKVDFNYPIINNQCDIVVTGNESIINVEQKELYTDFAELQSVKTQTENNNVLFFGNVSKIEHDYDALQRIAWKIIPKERRGRKALIGNINTEYQSNNTEDNSYCYYNSKNTYYYLGYWPDEIYRFGIVYIFNDNSVSPVFNIQGMDFSQIDSLPDDLKRDYSRAFFQNGDTHWEATTEDYYFNKSIEINNTVHDITSLKLNSRGVIKFSKDKNIARSNGGVVQPIPVGIEFDLSLIGKERYDNNEDKNYEETLKEHGIKGFFFVRQKRIPTIFCQGVAIGVTKQDYGSIPVLKNMQGQYEVESFLQPSRLLSLAGSPVIGFNNNVTVTGLLCPEAELLEGVYNDIFVANEYCLVPQYQLLFEGNSQHCKFLGIYDDINTNVLTAKLLNVPEDISVITDGENYYSTLAGNASEPYKTKDVKHAWNQTPPQDLTESISVIRGQFGAFVGVGAQSDGSSKCQYGYVYNVKKQEYAVDEEQATLLDFQKRFNDYTQYHAICDRTPITNKLTCYRGDCYVSMFTHRMHRNFIDPELPTNHTIVDPACWAANYGVRCTAEILDSAHSNMTDDSNGWVIPSPVEQPWVSALILFLTGNIFGAIKKLVEKEEETSWDPTKAGLGDDYIYDSGTWYEAKYEIDSNGNVSATADKTKPYDPKNKYKNGYANEIVTAFEVYKGNTKEGRYLKSAQKKKKVNPSEQESGGSINFKAIFRADEDWDLRGLAGINRADVNAVGLGKWVTFPILASRNIGLRDIDYSNSTEQASFNKKRSFYPLSKMDKLSPLRDSNVINAATSVSLPHKPYFALLDYRFLKQEYFTRVYNSITDSSGSYSNEYKTILNTSYCDYTKQCGSITKMITVNNITYTIFEHGIGYTTFKATESGDLPQLMQDVILLTDNYGSIWKDSVIDAGGVIYGVDSVAKKIWSIANNQFKIISDFKVQKFLIDNLDMSEFVTKPYLGHRNIKTHFNAYKNDVIFTYYNDIPLYNPDNGDWSWTKGTSWALCYSQITDTFVTFQDWIPAESVNIDNIFFSFDRERFNILTDLEREESQKVICNMDTLDANAFSNVNVYYDKKFVLDEAFNHRIPIYELKEGSSIALKPKTIFRSKIEKLEGTPYILAFYSKGLIKITKHGSKIYEIVNSTEWQHTSLIIPYCNKDYINIQIQATGKTEIAEISLCPIEYIEEVAQYYNKKQTQEVEVFNEDKTTPLVRYNLRNTQEQMFLWKHGQAGIYDIQGIIKPTNWYGRQYGFNFEFIVNEQSSVQKIFNNLKIISNKTEPCKFEYEIVGEGYEWYPLKPVIKWINDSAEDVFSLEGLYLKVLSTPYGDLVTEYPDFPKLDVANDYIITKLPYLDFKTPHDYQESQPHQALDHEHTDNSSKTVLVYDKRQNDYNIRTTQLGNNIKKVGRAKGNMQYLEDLWDVEIRPIAFKYVYIDNVGNLVFTSQKETRHRDKYLKVKVCYSGEDLAVIQAIQTTFDFSYA